MAFDQETLTNEEIGRLKELARLAKGDIVKMTRLAGSGHPGGSMSSLDMYLVVFSHANLSGAIRDRVIVSHGHTSPGVYAALARLGHLPVDEVIAFFRKTGSPFEGHVVRGLPFIDWSTGNLGQGLSAGCGFALGSKLKKEDGHVYVLMSDGEQAKGQVAEARRFAKKYCLDNITVLIDYNRIQISGCVDDVMPVNIIENYLADGWDVLEVDGHDAGELYAALRKARQTQVPTCILANTVIGKGVPFMEGKAEYHGRALNDKEYPEALVALGIDDDFALYKEKRKGVPQWKPQAGERDGASSLITGVPFTYSDADGLDNRSAFGKALKDLADKNIPGGKLIAAFDCDLASSVKTSDFCKCSPDQFFQCGVQEHNAATIAGALSAAGVVTFFADFGVFALDETYNQHRLNDINKTNLKVVGTHLGLDVGQDGKTHQCIDYIGLTRNLYNFRAIIPADTNQVDRVTRYIASTNGNFFIGTGRGKWPIIHGEKGAPFFGNGYEFKYGTMDVIRTGKDAAVITYGGMLGKALAIRENLAKEGVSLAVVNMACVDEVDEQVMQGLLGVKGIFTYEDHNPATGIMPPIAYYLLQKGYKGKVESFGVKAYGKSGETEELFKAEGLDVESMTQALLAAVK
ncbi:MAG TPA: transketolase [Syntrophorhabdales bacterium]|nr:transketolase [Syntrophorhabdales bacterium]